MRLLSEPVDLEPSRASGVRARQSQGAVRLAGMSRTIGAGRMQVKAARLGAWEI
jgi:hypothetical protein